MKSSLLLLLFMLAAKAGYPQLDTSKVRQDMATLTSRELAGRGYQEEGHRKAADFITERFRSIGLEPVYNLFKQSFAVEVNIVEESMLVLNGDTLEPGVEYLPYATTGSGSGENVARVLDAEQGLFIPDLPINQIPIHSARGTILLMNDQFPDSITANPMVTPNYLSDSYRIQLASAVKAGALLFTDEKLDFNVPYYRDRIPVFEVAEGVDTEQIKSVSYRVASRFDTVETFNVVGKITGSAKPDSVMLLMAHYDHFGTLGPDIYFPGANDNASGVSMLLALARHFEAHPPQKTIIFCAFGAEEVGLRGSKVFLDNLPISASQINFLFNYDMVASGEEGIVAVGGSDFPERFNQLSSLNDSLALGPIKPRKNAPNSDHYHFLEVGIPGFYLYTNRGKQPYHSIFDRAGTVELEDFAAVYQLSLRMISELDQE